SHRQLTRQQIELLTRWVAQGADYEVHWAFQSVRRPELPRVARGHWPHNDVDRFILSRLEAQGLAPSPRAPMPTLLRRISFDVTGLPPAPAQLAEWQAADNPIASALDELLASPHYGERMASDWLDVARYADTHGFNNDSLRTMWPWRDWVVDAFNANMPYDQFLTKQLAGDLLPDRTPDDLIATGFNRNHVINSEGGIIDEEYRVEYVADRVRTMSLAWLGLTLECARCHDHKFDPISQREYYRVFAFFNNVDEIGEDGRIGNAAPLMRAPTSEQRRQYDKLLKDERSLENQLRQTLQFRTGDAGSHASPSVPTSPHFDEKRLSLAAADEPTEFPGAKPVNVASKAFDLHGGWLLTAWVKRAEAAAGPIVSTMNFSAPASANRYGSGMEVGIAENGAVDVKLAIRWPGYSLQIRSVDAMPVGQWRHIAVSGRGNKAEGFRIFIDGVEVETEIRHDGLTGNVGLGAAVTLGHSGAPSDNVFHGTIRRLRIISGNVEEGLLEEFLKSELLSPPVEQGADIPWQRRAALASAGKSNDERITLLAAAWNEARKERLAHQRTFPTMMIMRELSEPRPTFLLERGQYDKPAEWVSADVPSAIGLPLPEGDRDRLALARWLTDRRHPLTARVVVNRIWQRFFGVGLVKTVGDFGFQGEWPSHPELLDWLAADFMESGWDVKRLVRMIVESAAYQQDSSATAERWANDPENRLIARGPRQRLTAEMIRDQALAVSGLLVPKLGGTPVFPYQPSDLYKGIVVAAPYPGTSYQESSGEDLYRRSLYTFWKRTVPHPTLATFDAPDREFCTARRSVTNTPLQALVLMNDPTFLEAARKLGERMRTEGGPTDESRLAWAFELLTARKPSSDEIHLLVELLNKQRDEFSREASVPTGLLEAGESKPDDSHDAAELAAYANVASLLLNLDEAIKRN
ncbi:MAG TPA: DUF1553 domain-containing protein, partial [Lacipirellula sp.]